VGEVMKEFKSSASRLARVFWRSREKWRAQAAQKQKKLRALEIRVRDLEASRARWKERAQAAEQELKRHVVAKPSVQDGQASKAEAGVEEQSGEVTEGERERAVGHRFAVWLVALAVRLVTEQVVSFRGGGGVLAVMGARLAWRVPSWSGLMGWVDWLGLYACQQPVVYGRDWIVIVDLSIELGPAKMRVIVGIRRTELEARRAAARQAGQAQASLVLHHHDVQILELAVLRQSTGEVIARHLEALRQRVGPFVQLISDQGSDVRKGVEQTVQRHPETRSTYDVTPQVALWLKHELSGDARFGQFLEHLQRTAQAV
jgi:hypothetical protein